MAYLCNLSNMILLSILFISERLHNLWLASWDKKSCWIFKHKQQKEYIKNDEHQNIKNSKPAQLFKLLVTFKLKLIRNLHKLIKLSLFVFDFSVNSINSIQQFLIFKKKQTLNYVHASFRAWFLNYKNSTTGYKRFII